MRNEYEVRGDTVAIFINRKDGTVLEALIDKVDFDKANKLSTRWYASFDKRIGSCYVHGRESINGHKTTYVLHRLIMDATSQYVVDHINHDTLDNRRSCNLRLVTQAQNNQNRKGAQANSKSGIRGVHWSDKEKRWVASICINKRRMTIGFYSDITKAEQAIKDYRSKYMPFSQEARAISS